MAGDSTHGEFVRFRLGMKKIAKASNQELAAAVYEEALLVEQESRRRTPVDTGALRASHVTTIPEINKDEIRVEISVGGPAAPYAVAVHEKVEVRHPVGQAKFLESAVLEAAREFPTRVAVRIDLNKVGKL